MRVRRYSLLIALVVSSVATTAHAQLVATPFMGGNLAGDAEFRRGGPGLALGVFGDRVGFEVEVQRYFHFFKDRNVDLIPNNCGVVARTTACIDLNTRAWSYMGNVVFPLRGNEEKWRPYATAGVGMIHPWIEGPGTQYDVDQTDMAFNVGAGVSRSVTGIFGFRSDLRYIRAIVDKDNSAAYKRDYGFVRMTMGITLALPR
ncbi:MAG: hypothetical protein V4550_20750 [Gemmatimonadota bacterium]